MNYNQDRSREELTKAATRNKGLDIVIGFPILCSGLSSKFNGLSWLFGPTPNLGMLRKGKDVTGKRTSLGKGSSPVNIESPPSLNPLHSISCHVMSYIADVLIFDLSLVLTQTIAVLLWSARFTVTRARLQLRK